MNNNELHRLFWSTDKDRINHILTRLNPKYLKGLHKRCLIEFGKKHEVTMYMNSEEYNNERFYRTTVEVKYDGCIFDASLSTLLNEINRRKNDNPIA
jgi:hypothetical protein